MNGGVPLLRPRSLDKGRGKTAVDQEIGELVLRPGTGGIFEVRVNTALVWSRKAEGKFPDIVELKRRVRDHVSRRDLGHADRAEGAV